MKNDNKISDPLEDLLEQVSDYELDKKRKIKYTRLKSEAMRKSKSKKIWIGSSLAAASIIIIVVILNFNHTKFRPTDLYNDFFKPHYFRMEYRGTLNPNHNFAVAVKLFEEEKLEQSKQVVDGLLNQDKNNPDYLLLKSQILMGKKDFVQALEYLEQVIHFGGSYERAGLWYISLVYLALEDFDNCLMNLDTLLSFNNSAYKQSATRLKKKIPSNFIKN